MQRFNIPPRQDWQGKCQSLGFQFHTDPDGTTYWDETACYVFYPQAVDMIERATNELHARCLEVVNRVVNTPELMDRLQIPAEHRMAVKASWDCREPSLYGRFDFMFDGVNPPKMLEYNADTPTSLLEASVAQWFWQGEVFPEHDQYNFIHDRLLSTWGELAIQGDIHFGCVANSLEDARTTIYIMDTAAQAGLNCNFSYMESIGLDSNTNTFVDNNMKPIRTLFKLYPWEWMVKENFGSRILFSQQRPETAVRTIEPAWKMILSNKGILPLLWEMFPNHPNLLPCYFSPEPLNNKFVQKPLFGREGANVTIQDGTKKIYTEGVYNDCGYVYQQMCPIPDFEGNHPVIGSWVIGGVAAGIGIREDKAAITNNTSRFVPHVLCDGVFSAHKTTGQSPFTVLRMDDLMVAPPSKSACDCALL